MERHDITPVTILAICVCVDDVTRGLAETRDFDRGFGYQRHEGERLVLPLDRRDKSGRIDNIDA
jgi:hypothetical protein